MKTKQILPFILAIINAATAMAKTMTVPSSAYSTIQGAIDAASSGDTIQVLAGSYEENLTLKSGVNVLGAGFETTILLWIMTTTVSGVTNRHPLSRTILLLAMTHTAF